MRAPAFPMLPVVAGEAETRRQIVIYTLILAPLGVAPWLLGYAGPLYGIAAYRDRRRHDRAGAAGPRRNDTATPRASKCSRFSILYLFLLFAVLLVDRLSGGLSAQAAAHIAG